jgi:hypothetical protein
MSDARDDARGSRFDPGEFDFSLAASDAKAEADAAHLTEQLTLLLGSHQEMKGLVRRLESVLAERARKDAERDTALAGRLITADELKTAAQIGARGGADAAVATAAGQLNRAIQMVEALNLRIGQEEVRREAERRRFVWTIRYGAMGAAYTILLTAIACHSFGVGAGRARGYAEAMDEKAAASWANTEDGKFARYLHEDGVLDQMRTCSGTGWQVKKVDGGRVCYGNNSHKWFLQ